MLPDFQLIAIIDLFNVSWPSQFMAGSSEVGNNLCGSSKDLSQRRGNLPNICLHIAKACNVGWGVGIFGCLS